jgi:hypothetical protein
MKLSTRTAVACLAVAGLLGLALSSVAAVDRTKTSPALRVTGGCPHEVRPVVDFRPARMIPALHAIKAQVPRVYAHLTSQGSPAWPHFQIQALVHLNQLPLGGPRAGIRPPVRGLGRYETFAARACGRKAALASVLVFLQFPSCQLPCSFGWAYVTPTRAGWHLWTSYQV